MAPTTPTPSARLVRAAVAERAELRAHRERLLAAREGLRAELEVVEASLREVDERATLLDRLVGAAAPEPDAEAGPAIRRAAVQVLLALPDRPLALHYRDWFEALRAEGYEVLGKDPLAVFLTQLSRSPLVRKGTQGGVYELDRDAPRRLRHHLDALHDELRGLTATPSATADLTAIRARRAAITAQITQTEKALEEAEAVLSAPAATAGVAVAG